MMLRKLSDRRVMVAFGSALAILMLVGFFSFRSIAGASRSDGWVKHTHEVLDNVQRLLIGMASIESSSRSYALSGEEAYLAVYRRSAADAQQFQVRLRTLTKDNPAQQRRLAELEALLGERVQFAQRVIEARRTQGLAAAAAIVQTGEGQRIGDTFREIVRQLEETESALLAGREADARRRLDQTKAVLLFGTAFGLLITGAAGLGVRRDSARRALAEAALRNSEEKYRILVQGVHDYAILRLGPFGEILSWNPGAERMTGRTFEDVRGRNFAQFFTPEEIGKGRPEAILKKAAENGQHEEQGMRVRKDGSRFLVRTTFTALLDVDKKLIGYSVISRDMTESTESGAKYRGLLEAAPDAMVVVNQEGEIELLNLQAEKQFGYTRDELVGQQVKNIIPEGFAERLIADGTRSAADALAQQIGTGIELTARRKDGSEFPIELMLSPLQNADGILVTAAIRDISVRKGAELHLAQMEGRYRGLLEAAPDAMVVVNQSGEIVLLNLQAEKQFGYRRDELLGQKVTNIIPEGFAERLLSDGLRSAEDALAQQIGTGIELTARRKDGSEFPIELMLSPLQNADGILVTAAIRDISVRRNADKVLAQMEGRYRGLMEAAPDAMVVVNQAGEIVLLNVQAEKQFGYARNKLLGQKVTNIIPEGFAERLVADGLRSAEDALAQQIGTGIELHGLRSDGSEFPIELMLSPLQSPEGILVTAAVRNISVRKKAEATLLEKVEELNRSNEELGQFAYLASHDLQEPLRMVASYTALLARRYKGKLDKDADEFIAFAVEGASRMQHLIQDLLAYSRVGSKGTDLLETSSEEALEQALRNLRAAIEESGAVVTHDALPLVMADEMQLIQLFQNLVGNAIKYRRDGVSSVHVGATADPGSKWMFAVQDNGLGIEPQYFERIFGMFQRLHKREEYAGTGIGLAICKKIVERHGSSISVESQLGEGSTFRFALPAGEKLAA